MLARSPLVRSNSAKSSLAPALPAPVAMTAQSQQAPASSTLAIQLTTPSSGSQATSHNPATALVGQLQAQTGMKVSEATALIEKTVQEQQRWLLFHDHCSTCKSSNGDCEMGPRCETGRRMFAHVHTCSKERCNVPNCAQLKLLLRHKRGCTGLKAAMCPICAPVSRYVSRKRKEMDCDDQGNPLAFPKFVAGPKQQHSQASCAAATSSSEAASLESKVTTVRNILRRVGLDTRLVVAAQPSLASGALQAA